MNQDRDYLREWLAFVDTTGTEDDWRKFIRVSLEQFAAKALPAGPDSCGETVTPDGEPLNPPLSCRQYESA
jgi:hypothetical protein